MTRSDSDHGMTDMKNDQLIQEIRKLARIATAFSAGIYYQTLRSSMDHTIVETGAVGAINALMELRKLIPMHEDLKNRHDD